MRINVNSTYGSADVDRAVTSIENTSLSDVSVEGVVGSVTGLNITRNDVNTQFDLVLENDSISEGTETLTILTTYYDDSEARFESVSREIQIRDTTSLESSISPIQDVTTEPEQGNQLNYAGTYSTSDEFLWWGRMGSIEYASTQENLLQNNPLIINDGHVSWTRGGSNFAIRHDVEALIANDGVFVNIHSRNVLKITADAAAYDLKLIVSDEFISELENGTQSIDVSDFDGDGDLDTTFQDPRYFSQLYRILSFNYLEDEIEIAGQASGGVVVEIA